MMQAPSLQPHYRAFNTTTNLSAPALRYVPRAGSYVPQSGLACALAAYTPDAMQSVNRLPSTPCSGVRSSTTLSTSPNISTLHRSVHFRSTSQATRDSSFFLPFPETLTTSSLRKTQHQVVWSVFLQTLTGGPTSIQIEVQKVVLFSTSLSSFRNTRCDLFGFMFSEGGLKLWTLD